MTVVFKTKGRIDPRAFTIGGLSSKPNSDSPIGRFGTGLKYSIASLVRLGAEPIVWIGRDRYTFKKKSIEFREKNFDLITMEKKRWAFGTTKHEMPFTTEYGRDWKPWMIFRELEANTRDEGGDTYYTDVEAEEIQNTLEDDVTIILVDDLDFHEAYEQRDSIFLPQDRTPIYEDSDIQCFAGESQYLFWRGMRVLDLGKKSRYTWNFLRWMDLTEDRTLRSEFLARTYVADWLTKQPHPELIKELITIGEEYWESSMDFTWASAASHEFRAIARERPEGMLRSAQSWADTHEPLPKEEVPDSLGRPWELVGDVIRDYNGRSIFRWPPIAEGAAMTCDLTEWTDIARAMIEVMNKDKGR